MNNTQEEEERTLRIELGTWFLANEDLQKAVNDAKIQRILFQWASGNEEYMENPL